MDDLVVVGLLVVGFWVVGWVVCCVVFHTVVGDWTFVDIGLWSIVVAWDVLSGAIGLLVEDSSTSYSGANVKIPCSSI